MGDGHHRLALVIMGEAVEHRSDPPVEAVPAVASGGEHPIRFLLHVEGAVPGVVGGPRGGIGVARVDLAEITVAGGQFEPEARGDDLRGLDGSGKDAGDQDVGVDAAGGGQMITQRLGLPTSERGETGTTAGPRDRSVEPGVSVTVTDEDEAHGPTVPTGPSPIAATPRRSSTDTVDPVSPVIEVRDLVKRYGDRTAVDRVSFTVGRGEFFGLLGPNAAGKTTILEIVEGLRRADGGEVSLLGSSPWPRDIELSRRIGVQLQAASFFEKLTVDEQIRTFADLYGAPRDAALEQLELVGLTDAGSVRTEALSGGQKQRLSIACTLVNDPEVVFLDEPTASLDPQARRNLWDVLRSIQARGRTVVLTTHHMDEAEQLCDRVAIIDHGRLLTVDSPANLIRALDAPVRISIVANGLSASEARSLPGVDAVEEAHGQLDLVTASPAIVLPELGRRNLLEGLAVHGGTLEDVFLDLTGREYRS